MISLVPSCIHLVQLSKRMSYPIISRIDSVWKFLPRCGMLALTLEFEKVRFHFENPLELLGQDDRVMKRNTSRVMKHNPILQGAMWPTIMERKVTWATEKFSSIQLS
jgi:hypothetical protein